MGLAHVKRECKNLSSLMDRLLARTRQRKVLFFFPCRPQSPTSFLSTYTASFLSTYVLVAKQGQRYSGSMDGIGMHLHCLLDAAHDLLLFVTGAFSTALLCWSSTYSEWCPLRLTSASLLRFIF